MNDALCHILFPITRRFFIRRNVPMQSLQDRWCHSLNREFSKQLKFSYTS